MTNSGEAFDVVIVGGGHNGLTCGAFLARAGMRVTILEATERVGGFARTEALMDAAPGFHSMPYAIDLFSGMVPRSVFVDLELSRHGLQTYEADPYATYLAPDGSSIAQWRDVERTAREIAPFSRRDAIRYKRFAEVLCVAWNALLPYLQDHPTRPRPKTIAELVWRLGGARKSLGPAARIILDSPASVLEEWFERDELKVILGTWAAATAQTSLDTPGYGAGMAMAVLSHRWGCHRAVGGMGAVSESIRRCFEAHGGTVRISTPVREIEIRGGRATAAVLEDGTRVAGSTIVAGCDPITLFSKLVPTDAVPEQTRDELRAVKVCEQNVTYFTGHAALSARPSFPRHGRSDELIGAGYQMLVPSYDRLVGAIDDAIAGRMPADIPIWLSFPSVRDRSLVPADSQGESLYMMSPVTPYELADGRPWSEAGDEYLERCLTTIDDYAVGTRDATIATAWKSPQDMAGIAHKGHACHVDMDLTQFGPWRPTPSLGGYRTPIDGLWHVSAGNHPLPSVNGWAGRTAARTLLRGGDSKKRRPGGLMRRVGPPGVARQQPARAPVPTEPRVPV